MDYIDKIENIVKSQQIFHSILEGNEAQTRWLLIDPFILDCLGYDRKDIIVEYSLNQEDRVSKYEKVDYCVIVKNEPRLLIEAKSLGVNVFEKFDQLESYFNKVIEEHQFENRYLVGILTDGDLYLLYTNTSQNVMDKEPFYTIRLSDSEDFERLKLLGYSKERLLECENEVDIVYSDEEFYLHTAYRIDSISSVIDYFLSQNCQTEIESIYLKGVLNTKIKNYKSLYKLIIKEVDRLKPDLIYSLAQREFNDANGTIGNLQFSLNSIHSGEYAFSTKYGKVYISMPKTDKGYIDRIVNFVKVSGYGLHNIMVSLKSV